MNWIKTIVALLCTFSLLFFSEIGVAQANHNFNDSISSKEYGEIISLTGKWDIAEGNMQKVPTKFPYKITVPGLVNNTETNFKEIGIESNKREAYWYRKTFKIAGAIPAVARLKIFKAMFGSKVFLNGKLVGENPLNFTPGYFDLKPYLKGNNQKNELIVRVGAFIDKTADTVLNGGDAEKHRYVPGIYDRVEVILSNSAYILRAQVAPNIVKQEVKINIDAASVSSSKEKLPLIAKIFEFKTGKLVASQPVDIYDLDIKHTNSATITMQIPDCKLWTPETPNLYILQLSNGAYSYCTRFGMRTFSVDTTFTNRTLLNNIPCYIRGTNFAINRFYEDPLCLHQAWDKAWVRKLISSYRSMGMNGVRFSISSAPEIWYDIADEEGMMVFDEFPIWSAYQPQVGSVNREAKNPLKKWAIVKTKITAAHITNEFTNWMQERWNHPCVIVWDAQNETWTPETGKAINQVRGLDLSNRPWDNGWSPPASKSDLREAHPYFEAYTAGTEQQNDRKIPTKPFTLDHVPENPKVPSTFYLPYQYAYKDLPLNWYWQQAVVNNEYSYLWLNRDGSPTKLTKGFYDAALGENATANQRRELYAKYLAAVTEYWRSLRTCVAILYPFGINYSMPEGETSDNLIDLDNVKFDDYFLKYVPSSFAPIAISIDYWQTKIALKDANGTAIDVPLFITNDTNEPSKNDLSLILMKENEVISAIKTKYEVAALQQSRIILRIDLPNKHGKYYLMAEMKTGKGESTKSYRDIELIK